MFPRLCGVLFALAMAVPTTPASALDPLAARQVLWQIVSKDCVPEKQAGKPPAPCLDVVLDGTDGAGFAVLKDLRGIAQVLLIPTREISGIEDPKVLEPSSARYWPAAWAARSFVFRYLPHALPSDAVSLAVNSQRARSQDQLHVHVDCIRPDVRRILQAHLDSVRSEWAPFPVALDGKRYNALRLDEAEFGRSNPFALVAQQWPEARGDMGAETIFVAGATFADGKAGFVMLENRAGRVAGDFAHAEDLQDHDCAVAKE